MKKHLLLILLTIFILRCTPEDNTVQERPASKVGIIHINKPQAYNSYYSSIDNIHSSVLKNSLHKLIKNHKILNYTYGGITVWDALKKTDEDPNNPNNVIELYTGNSINKRYKDNGHNGDNVWNREHVWVKSRGFGGDPKKIKGPSTDIHHIRPADRSVNTARSTKVFDNGGSPHHEATECKTDSDSWEPRDAVKGDVARMLFYMAVRYEGGDGFKDLKLVENPTKGSFDPYMGKLLMQWHKQDPVDAFERKRNQTIFEIQGNRNPFIDHEELVEYIW